jgi:crotonobetainyl-CoA:carnitine CoA-transferase CaiB-like acyl-CoA transferase
MTSVLEGIKVLDFTQVYAGPYCTLLLKDFGAEIIKVERPGSGDLIRNDVPRTEFKEGGNFITLNRGKKSLSLDLKSDKGRDIVKKLVPRVDVIVENFSPGTMEKLGLGSQELCKLHPGLIYASISAYGQTGPRRDLPGFDAIAQVMGGLVNVTGFPDAPVRCGISIGDFASGMFAALAIISALFYRMKTGVGQTIDISMQDVIWQLTSIEFAPYYFLEQREPPRFGNQHSAMVPSDLFPTADGGRVLICAGMLEQVKRLYVAMGREDLLNSPLYANQSERQKLRSEIHAVITEWTRNKNTEEIISILKEADVPCARLPAFSEICNDEQLLSRNMIIEVEQTLSGKVKVPGSLFKLSKTPGNVNYPAPMLGEHNAEVLSQMLGSTEKEIAQLDEDRVI